MAVVTGFDFPGFHQVATGGRFRTSVPSPTYDPNYYNPHFGALEATPEYWERLMSSSYAVQLQRIYGVPGSEYVGYAPTELNIGTSNVHPFPANHQPITVSSNVSFTDVKPVVEAGSEVNFTKLETSCYKNPVYLEKGLFFLFFARNNNRLFNLGIENIYIRTTQIRWFLP